MCSGYVSRYLFINFKSFFFQSTFSDEKLDLHELCTTSDSSSEDDQSLYGTPKDTTDVDETSTKNVTTTPEDTVLVNEDTVTEVDNAQEARELIEIEILKTEKTISRSEILSIISSNRSSNQSGTSMNVESLPEKNKR